MMSPFALGNNKLVFTNPYPEARIDDVPDVVRIDTLLFKDFLKALEIKADIIDVFSRMSISIELLLKYPWRFRKRVVHLLPT